MIIKNGLVYQEDKTFVKKDLYINDGKIVEGPRTRRKWMQRVFWCFPAW